MLMLTRHIGEITNIGGTSPRQEPRVPKAVLVSMPPKTSRATGKKIATTSKARAALSKRCPRQRSNTLKFKSLSKTSRPRREGFVAALGANNARWQRKETCYVD